MSGEVKIHETETDWGRIGKTAAGVLGTVSLGWVAYKIGTEAYDNRTNLLKGAGLSMVGLSGVYLALRDTERIGRRVSNNHSVGTALGVGTMGAVMAVSGWAMERDDNEAAGNLLVTPLDTSVSVQGTNLVNESGSVSSTAERSSDSAVAVTTEKIVPFPEQGTIGQSDSGRVINVPLPPIAETRGDGICVDPEAIQIPEGGSYWSAMRGNDSFDDLTDDDLTDITKVSDFMRQTILHPGDLVDFACP